MKFKIRKKKTKKKTLFIHVQNNHCYPVVFNDFEYNFLCLSLQIDGEADFVIPLDALHRFDPTLDIDTLVVEANVTESPTGISDTGSTKVQFHKDIWKIEFFGAKEDYFKPGFKYTTYVSTSAILHRKYVGMQVTILRYFSFPTLRYTSSWLLNDSINEALMSRVLLLFCCWYFSYFFLFHKKCKSKFFTNSDSF